MWVEDILSSDIFKGKKDLGFFAESTALVGLYPALLWFTGQQIYISATCSLLHSFYRHSTLWFLLRELKLKNILCAQ